MAKYVYPAIFEKDEQDLYSITFPDLPNCISGGENIQDAMENAADALCLVLYHMEQKNETIPTASSPIDIKTAPGAFVTLIGCDTLEYEKFYKNKAVKKTLTIPEWLNDMALRENVNFSNVLQNALMEQLNINR